MARLVLSSGETVSLASGNYNIFGTSSGRETVTIAAGATVTLDGSFNAGGDTISLGGNATDYTVVRSGSSVVLTYTTGGSVTIPVGTSGTTIAFADASRNLVFNTGSGSIELGNQAVSATISAVTAGTGVSSTAPTFTLTKSVASVDEDGTVLFTLATTGVAAGSDYTYTLSGVSASDVTGGALTGTAKIGSDGKAVIQVNLAEDARTEGTETLTLSVAGQSTSVSVVDTSTAPGAVVATYNVTADAASVNEGGTATFRVQTTNVSSGSQLAYSLSGVSASDVTGGSLTGLATVGADGVALVSVNLVADATTEGAETLTLNIAGKSASVSVEDTSTAPVEQTSFTVTPAAIAAANVGAGSPVTVDVGNTGSRTVTIQSDGATPTAGVIINGDANTTVTSGALGDRITLSGNGNNTINTAGGNDTVTVFGTGNNSVNVGSGTDSVTTGAGSDTITFGSGALGAGDVVDAGAGNDTVVISGDGNVIGAGGATLTGVENLVLDGTTVGITSAALATLVTNGLVSISGHPSTSVITVTATPGATIDLTDVSLNDLNNLRIDAGAGGAATLRLSAEQISELATITEVGTTVLTVNTTVAGFQALGTKATGATLTITDSVENLVAAGNTISGATATLGDATVAQAASALASGLTVSYTLVDTAANLALAPTAVFTSASAVTISGEATAAQATAIQTSIAAANGITVAADDITAASLTLNVVDTASNVSNYLDDAIDADTVTTAGGQALTVAQATALAALNANATFQIVDAPTNLAGAPVGTLNRASQISATGPLTVAQVVAINVSTTDITPGYALTDSLNNLTNAASSVINNAANITANNVSVLVSEALALEALGNTGTTSYVLADSLVNVLAASSQVTSSASAVSVSDATLTAANLNSLINKFGTAKVSDASLAVSDTVANLLNLSADSVAEATSISISSGTATAQQALSLKALTGAKMPVFTVSDTAANLSAAFATTANVGILELATAVNVTGTASVAEIIALNTSLAADGIGRNAVGTFGLLDTAANLSAVAAATNTVVSAATTVAITGDVTLAQLTTIDARAGTDPTGFNLVGSAIDLFALGATPGTQIDRAANVTVSGDATLAQIQGIAAAYTTTGDDAVLGTSLVYSITDLPSAFDTAVVADLAILNAATSATMVGTKAQIFGGTLTTAKRDVADVIIATDALANLTFTTEQLAEIDAIQITDAALAASAANATAINALTVAKPTSYTLEDTLTALTAPTGTDAQKAAIATLVQGAAAVDVTNASLTVAQFNTLDALTAGTVKAAITGTVAQLSAANAAAAISSARATGETVTITDTAASVEQATTLASRLGTAHVGVTALVVTDTAAAIQAAASDLVTAVNSFVVSDNGFITGSVALVSKVYAANANSGSSYGNYAIVDTAANVAAVGAASAVNFAQSVTVTGTALQGDADTLGALTAMGPITYSISDTAAAIAGGTAAGRNGATNITATSNATLAQAVTINGATNSGTTSYSITELNASVLVSANAEGIAAIEAATGTVSVTFAANAAEAEVLAAFAKPVTFDLLDTAAAVAAVSGLGEARNIVVLTTATAAEAATILAAPNSGNTTLAVVEGAAAEVLPLTLGANDTINTLSVTGTTTIADAVAINAKDTGANIGAVRFATVSGSYADLLANKAAANLATVGVTVTGAMTVAQVAALDAAITPALTYSIADSFANIMADTTPGGAVDNGPYTGRSVTATDSALTLAQATSLRTTGAASYVYSIQDNDANIVAAVNADSTVLTGATSVRGADGAALTIGSFGGDVAIVGTKAQLDGLSTVLQGATKVYDVSVADLAANPDFYVQTGLNFRVTDTVANLVSGNALLPRAVALVATDAATVAQATTLTTLGVTSVSYSLTDTAAAISGAAGVTSVVDRATNVVVTGTATFAQAATIDAEANSGTLTMDISDAAGSFAAGSLNAARNITVTGSLSSTDATTLLAATNSGATTIANVAGSSANLAALTVTANDTITSLTPNTAATVAQLTAMQARSSTITAYGLNDTAANLATATAAQLDGAVNILANTPVSVSLAATLEGASNTGTTRFDITDTAANILAAPTALLGADDNDSIIVSDTTVSAAVATQLRAFDTANAGFAIAGGGVFVISDTVANLTAEANAAAVAASTDVRITGDVTVTEAAAVDAAATNDTPTYNLADTYSRLVAGGATTTNATNVRITNLVTVAQANQARNSFGVTDAELIMDIRDNAAALFAGINGVGVTAAETITLSTTATVAQAGVISESAKLVGGYAISDSAAAVASAINTVNAAGAADRDTVLGATSVSLTTAATVAQALGDRATEARGIFTLPGVSYAITDSPAAIIAALAGSDAVGIDNATSVRITDVSVTVEQAGALTALANFVGDDGLGGYDIADGFAAVQLANEALVASASTVRANGTADPQTIDMSGIGRAVYVNGNGGADTLFGTDFADTVDGGTGADVMTGGNGRDGFVVASDSIDDVEAGGAPAQVDERFTDSSTLARDQIIDFTLATAGWTGSAANDTVAEFQALAIGGSAADILDINLAGVTLVKATGGGVNANGVLQGVTGTLTDAVTLASGATAADSDGEAVVFEHGGNSYVFVQNGDYDILVELTAVTGVAGLGLLAGSGDVGGANWVIVG